MATHKVSEDPHAWVLVSTPNGLYVTRATRCESGEYSEVEDNYQTSVATPGSFWQSLDQLTTDGYRCHVLQFEELITLYEEQISCFRTLIAVRRAEHKTKRRK